MLHQNAIAEAEQTTPPTPDAEPPHIDTDSDSLILSGLVYHKEQLLQHSMLRLRRKPERPQNSGRKSWAGLPERFLAPPYVLVPGGGVSSESEKQRQLTKKEKIPLPCPFVRSRRRFSYVGASRSARKNSRLRLANANAL